MAGVRDLGALHEYLLGNLRVPMLFDDLLRFQMVYAVSALDKLVHDVVRLGMVDMFLGNRKCTAKYLAERISLSVYRELSAATIPPKEYYFEQEVISRLKFTTYQSPDNIAEGLSYIWEEKYKWQKISGRMSMSESEAKTRLRLIVDRRNKIAHEADMDIVSGGKFAITKGDCDSSIMFIERCGEAIVSLVRS